MNPGLIGYLIALAFAVYWLDVGASAVGGSTGTIVLIAGAIILLGALARVWLHRHRPTSLVRFSWGWYFVALGAEIVAMNVAILTLPKDFLAGYQAPVIGTIVGLHFIGLWLASRMPRFLTLSVAMTALNLAAFALPPNGAPVLAGLGSAALLAGAVAA